MPSYFNVFMIALTSDSQEYNHPAEVLCFLVSPWTWSPNLWCWCSLQLHLVRVCWFFKKERFLFLFSIASKSKWEMRDGHTVTHFFLVPQKKGSPSFKRLVKIADSWHASPQCLEQIFDSMFLHVFTSFCRISDSEKSNWSKYHQAP